MNLSLYSIISLSPSIPKRCRYCLLISRRLSSSPPRRRHFRRRLLHKKFTIEEAPPSDQNLQFILTVDNLPTKSLYSFKDLLHSKLDEFVHSGRAAIDDLQTLIRIDSNDGRLLFSCRRTTVKFVGTLLLTSFLVIFTLRTIFKLVLGLRHNTRNNNVELVYKRDRSLGGREVLVAKNEITVDRKKPNVLDGDDVNSNWGWASRIRRRKKKSSVEQLPKWWPVSSSGSDQVGAENQEEYQRMANRLIRAILDNRMTGRDILADDIIQLRRIGRISNVKVSFDTENARDTLYRVAVDFVLNYCESTASQSAFVLIDGEEAQKFVAGLADNVGLESTRAARMVSAAVAARTRSRFLQAWALEIQGKHSEAVVELFKVCVIHQIFPPEEFSPEMEMVARGLEKHLKLDQREFLMNTLLRVCGDETRRSVAEALGLMYLKDNIVHQQENKYT
ncbi:putative CMP-sialic acid transporter 2-like [Capsicum annuum]|uniref:uncharacterized protein LOC107864407 n=1 Tax=Capsicum annuum TaxID=4072 RepID=UPI0007BFA391|nr:uncharacterized protein LOC107864407 [Capsicum annuum]KAF3673509.1 putative CMP-sialic acid transporter 2-like [Capsicum annuum]KAF3679559.1 putative CMP-sialic acid transporter 2-like [Capsicum annuum]